MRNRHQAPTLVSMWMLDVFCCALGCVTLLWLDKTRQAAVSAEESEKVGIELVQSQQSVMDATLENLQLNDKIDDTANLLALVRKERDALADRLALVRQERELTAKSLALAESQVKATDAELLTAKKKIEQTQRAALATSEELAAAKKKIDDTAKTATNLRSQVAASEEELQKKQKELDSLTRRITKAQSESEELQRLLREREQRRSESEKTATAAGERASSLEKKFADAQKKLDALSKSQPDSAKMQARVTELEKEVSRDNAMIVDLQGEKAKLADKINKIQIEAEQKFAGIAMTGKRVVFLIDMSGSMERTDYDTLDATKWPTVRETLIKIMRSLPDLEKFQIVVFSSRANYLTGSSQDWLTYDKDSSIDMVRKKLAAVKPVGDTNMYSALEEAFRFRDRGLDTIYLLSDGLPTSGPGLNVSEEKLPEIERGNLLGKHIRRVLNNTWNKPSARQPRVRINSIGFFYESPDVGAFLWALSRENDGSFVGMSKP